MSEVLHLCRTSDNACSAMRSPPIHITFFWFSLVQRTPVKKTDTLSARATGAPSDAE